MESLHLWWHWLSSVLPVSNTISKKVQPEFVSCNLPFACLSFSGLRDLIFFLFLPLRHSVYFFTSSNFCKDVPCPLCLCQCLHDHGIAHWVRKKNKINKSQSIWEGDCQGFALFFLWDNLDRRSWGKSSFPHFYVCWLKWVFLLAPCDTVSSKSV